MDRYGVIGFPVAHSRSPFIHTRFAGQTGERLSYEAIEVRPEAFEETVTAFMREGGRGLNVTVPHKQAAFALADRLTPRAALARAVNTLRLEHDGLLLGDNTDGAGLVRDLRDNLHLRLAGKRILFAGAGGAAAGSLGPVLTLQPARVVVANRTAARARALAKRFATHGPVIGTGYDAIGAGPFDLIVNATSAGLRGATPAIPAGLAQGSTCYDMLFASGDTPFTAWASSNGAAAVHAGWGMLVEQAAESFFVWRGVRPSTGPVLTALKRSTSDR